VNLGRHDAIRREKMIYVTYINTGQRNILIINSKSHEICLRDRIVVPNKSVSPQTTIPIEVKHF
jgi:hypothetical protein